MVHAECRAPGMTKKNMNMRAFFVVPGGVLHCDVPLRDPDRPARPRLHAPRRPQGHQVPVRAALGGAAKHTGLEEGRRADVLLPGDIMVSGADFFLKKNLG